MKLNIKAFALTSGTVWGAGMFFLTWWVMAFDGVSYEPTLIGGIYRGYTMSPLGSLIGLAWGFFDGLFGGLVFAWLYNKMITYIKTV
ncbi:MAG: hypothetical protein AUJ51_12885 [Elusimicrobia bacterium CG1_02_56_21]|nr:MAG: hypothetical protein AUJ51_12885 [Elusimicrobia bacterium CG1_02_56_21]